MFTLKGTPIKIVAGWKCDWCVTGEMLVAMLIERRGEIHICEEHNTAMKQRINIVNRTMAQIGYPIPS